MGNQVLFRYMVGVVCLLIPSEMEMLAIESVHSEHRKELNLKPGKPIYSFKLYQKVKRVTIPRR